MEVCALPKDLEYPDADYKNYDLKREIKREEEHQDALKTKLIEMGFTGKHTGGILRVAFADGYAQYMMADGGRNKSYLVHLPYGDAWHSSDVKFLPKKEVVKRIGFSLNLPKIFV